MRNPQSASKCLLFYKLPLLDLFLSRFSEGNCERQLIAAGGGSSICVALGTVSGCKGNREGSKTSLIPSVAREPGMGWEQTDFGVFLLLQSREGLWSSVGQAGQSWVPSWSCPAPALGLGLFSL